MAQPDHPGYSLTPEEEALLAEQQAAAAGSSYNYGAAEPQPLPPPPPGGDAMAETRLPRGAPTPLHGMIPSVPDRFASWDDGTRERAREIWSTVGGRNAAVAERLLAAETAEGTMAPTASTIRRWSRADAWDAAADADLENTRGRTLRQLQVGWLAALQLAQTTLINSMTGGLDQAPYGGSPRLKAAEIVLRTIERAGLLAAMPDPAPLAAETAEPLSVDERLRRSREAMRRQKEQASRR
jgi:hypothetical protein